MSSTAPARVRVSSASSSKYVSGECDASSVAYRRDAGSDRRPDFADVLARAYAEDRIVVAFNVDDFVKLASECQLHCGLILLPSGSLPREQQLVLVKTAWALVLAEHQAGRDMINRVLYLEHAGGFRFEPLP